MRKASLFVLVGVLALFIGGCPSNEGEDVGEITPNPSPVRRQRTAQPSPSPAATPFANPVAPRQPGTAPAVTGLVPSLPAEVRIAQIPKGRTDPFAVVPVQPQAEVTQTAQGRGGSTTRPVPVLPQLPGPGGARRNTGTNQQRTAGTAGRGTAASRGNAAPRSTSQAARPSTNNRPNGTSGRPNNAPLPPPPPTLPGLVPELPPLPEPDIARAIAVTGVVQAGGRTNAIVQVPNEPTSRYVQAGQRVANGQVLVKRIEMNRGPTPVVILEQYGIEVARAVGDAPVETAEGAGSPSAALPPPPPAVPNVSS
ncbi:MAG: hypothetical protein F6K28_13310 [Microcoleus sp. SIO2G3]|nr:hypothetical protein [Microcoleus sp. SIO2G3]